MRNASILSTEIPSSNSGVISAQTSANIDSSPPAELRPDYAIEFNNVCQSFGEHKVLVNLNFKVKPGEKVTLIGPSGSGKTTVLRLAMTLRAPTSGDIKFFGESIIGDRNGKPISRIDRTRLLRRCGMVFQQYNLFPHLTVLQNLVLAPTSVLGQRKDVAEKDAEYYLQMVGLANKAKAYPSQLSGGQQQRVALARALILKPEILLLDEITSALDPELAREVMDVVRDVATQTGVSLLIVTHEMRFAREVSDRIVFFDAGRIVEEGTPNAIFGNLASDRTRAFLRSVSDH